VNVPPRHEPGDKGRNNAIEERIVFRLDLEDWVNRNHQDALNFLDLVENEALVLVADRKGRVEEAEGRLKAERAALHEAERKLAQVHHQCRHLRSELENAKLETERAREAIEAAALSAGYPYLDTKTIPFPFARIAVPFKEVAE
jgi:chromosome segregation ATPase